MNLLGEAVDAFGENGEDTGAMETRGDNTEAGLPAGKVLRGEEPAATSMRFSLRACL